MAVRTDIQFLLRYSPRIVLVEAPSIVITMQELVNVMREEEEKLINLDEFFFLDADGKNFLSPIKDVGITVKLLNFQVAFEGRTADIVDSTATSADPKGELLVDIGADFVNAGVKRGDTVINYDDHSIASVVEVVDLNTLLMLPLSGGTTDTWQISDHYHVHTVVIGEVTGGNLTAVAADGVTPIEPIFNTPFVSTNREADASAVLVGGSATVVEVDDSRDAVLQYIGQKIT